MAFDFRAQAFDRRGRHVGDLQDAMRVAHRHGRNVVADAVHDEFVAVLLLLREEGYATRLEFRPAHADADEAGAVDPRLDRTGRAQEGERLRMAFFGSQQACDAAHAIAALFDLGAVHVEDAVGRGKGRIVGGRDPHELVEAGPGRISAEFAQPVCGRRHAVSRPLVDDEYAITRAVHFAVSDVHGLFSVAAVVLHKPRRILITLLVERL